MLLCVHANKQHHISNSIESISSTKTTQPSPGQQREGDWNQSFGTAWICTPSFSHCCEDWTLTRTLLDEWIRHSRFLQCFCAGSIVYLVCNMYPIACFLAATHLCFRESVVRWYARLQAGEASEGADGYRTTAEPMFKVFYHVLCCKMCIDWGFETGGKVMGKCDGAWYNKPRAVIAVLILIVLGRGGTDGSACLPLHRFDSMEWRKYTCTLQVETAHVLYLNLI